MSWDVESSFTWKKVLLHILASKKFLEKRRCYHKNVPHRPPITGSLTNQGPRLLHSEIHHYIHAGALPPDSDQCAGILRKPIPRRHRGPLTDDSGFRTPWRPCQTLLRPCCTLRDLHPTYLPSFLPLYFTWSQTHTEIWQLSQPCLPTSSHRHLILSWHLLVGGPRITQKVRK